MSRPVRRNHHNRRTPEHRGGEPFKRISGGHRLRMPSAAELEAAPAAPPVLPPRPPPLAPHPSPTAPRPRDGSDGRPAHHLPAPSAGWATPAHLIESRVDLDVHFAIHPTERGAVDEGGDSDLDDDAFDAALEVFRAASRPSLASAWASVHGAALRRAWASVRGAALNHDRVPAGAEIQTIENCLDLLNLSAADTLHVLLEDVTAEREHSFALHLAENILDGASPEQVASDPTLGSIAELVALLCEAPTASPDFPDIRLRALDALRQTPIKGSWFEVRS